ncbi:MAG: flagellar basal body-associated protein FliL [Gammaproteobacteria bacterium]
MAQENDNLPNENQQPAQPAAPVPPAAPEPPAAARPAPRPNRLDDDEEEAEQSVPKSKTKIIIIASIILVLMLGGGGAAWWFLKKPAHTSNSTTTPAASTQQQTSSNTNTTEEASDAAEKEPAVDGETVLYYELEPGIVVNIESEDGQQHYLQIKLAFVTRHQEVVEAIKENKPLISNSLLEILSATTYKELRTKEGRTKLRQQTLETTREIISKYVEAGEIEAVLFTDYVMQ